MSEKKLELDAITNAFMVPLNSAEEVRNWVLTYLDIDLPLGKIDPDSNSSPAEAIWEVYDNYKRNRGDVTPGYIWLSSRDSFKTLSESILNVMLMAHFGATIAHLAAIESQASKAIEYVSSFVKKIQPYLAAHGKIVDSENKRTISVVDRENNRAYVIVIIASLAGANCVSPDSIVQTKDRGEVKVSSLVPGEYIKSFDYLSISDVWVKVGSISATRKPAMAIHFADGDSIVVSTDHMVFTDNGWKCAATVKIGERLTNRYKQAQPFIHVDTSKDVDRDPMQFILGSLLGDGCVYKQTKRHTSASFHGSYTEKSIDYIHLAERLLSPTFGVRVYRSDFSMKNGMTKRAHYRFQTRSHSVFTEMREKFYPNGIKTVTKEWLDLLSYEGVAYWIMDDGSGGPEIIGSKKDRSLTIATCSFSLGENQMICEWFQNKGYQCKVKMVRNSHKSYPVIAFTLDASRRLCEKVRKYFVKSMLYKLPATHAECALRTVDTDELRFNAKPVGFQWACSSKKRMWASHTEFRQWRSSVRSHLSSEVVRMEKMTDQDLIDVHVDTTIPHLHSFLINGGKLVHNSAHTNVLSIDEIDVMRFPKAYEEAKFIPGYSKGQNPITIKTSTRKFAFGLMEKEIQNIDQSGDVLLRWNILDVTERCPESRNKSSEGKVERYIHPRLPLRNISPQEHLSLPETKKAEYEKIVAHKGCASCPLLPVCKTRLAQRDPKDHGGLYKPITFAINQFKKMEPDMAEAQLMCWKPSQSGLIYARYEDTHDGNLKSIHKAWEQFTGLPSHNGITLKVLTDFMLSKGIQFEIGGDWGFRHAFALVVSALVRGEWWLIDSISIPGLDPDQQLKVAQELKDRYKIKRKWVMDTAQPGMMAMFKKNGMPCKEFKKDIQLGIALTKTQVVDASGKRRLFVLDHEGNQWLRQGFCKHHYKLDSAGDPTNEPDDDEYADIMDSIRYKAQVLFHKGNKPSIVGIQPNQPSQTPQHGFGSEARNYESWMMQQARALATEDASTANGSNKAKTIFWTFGGGDEPS